MRSKKKISKFLEGLKIEIDRMIEKYLPRKVNKKWLKFAFDDPGNKRSAQEVLSEPIWNFLDRGGKRWRPILFLLIAQAIGGDLKKIKDFSIIPELVHEGTLIVDDIQDNSELRRGKPCLHKIFGVDVAINAGNFLYFFPLLILIKNKNKFKPEILLKAFEIYTREMIRLHLGQGTDIFWHKGKEKNIKEKDYFKMCSFKTGCLPRLAVKLAAILSGKNEKIAEKLGRFAEKLSIAFQIQDDILDISLKGKEREKFGKAFGNDIKEGKRSLMVIYTLKKANKKDKKRLLEILDKHTDDLKEKREAIKIIEKYGGISYAKKVTQKLAKESWKEIEKILPPSEAKTNLKKLVNFLIQRKI